MPEIPTFLYIGVDYKSNESLLQVARQRLIDIVRWAAEDPTYRRFFPVNLPNPATIPLFGAPVNGNDPVQEGSVRSPRKP